MAISQQPASTRSDPLEELCTNSRKRFSRSELRGSACPVPEAPAVAEGPSLAAGVGGGGPGAVERGLRCEYLSNFGDFEEVAPAATKSGPPILDRSGGLAEAAPPLLDEMSAKSTSPSKSSPVGSEVPFGEAGTKAVGSERTTFTGSGILPCCSKTKIVPTRLPRCTSRCGGAVGARGTAKHARLAVSYCPKMA